MIGFFFELLLSLACLVVGFGWLALMFVAFGA